MAQHLRIGSVVDIYAGAPEGTPVYDSVTVTNITGEYLEFEWWDPSTTTVRVVVRSWPVAGTIVVVTD